MINVFRNDLMKQRPARHQRAASEAPGPRDRSRMNPDLSNVRVLISSYNPLLAIVERSLDAADFDVFASAAAVDMRTAGTRPTAPTNAVPDCCRGARRDLCERDARAAGRLAAQRMSSTLRTCLPSCRPSPAIRSYAPRCDADSRSQVAISATATFVLRALLVDLDLDLAHHPPRRSRRATPVPVSSFWRSRFSTMSRKWIAVRTITRPSRSVAAADLPCVVGGFRFPGGVTLSVRVYRGVLEGSPRRPIAKGASPLTPRASFPSRQLLVQRAPLLGLARLPRTTADPGLAMFTLTSDTRPLEAYPRDTTTNTRENQQVSVK